MATLYFCVWEDAGMVALGQPIQEGTIAIGGASAQGAVISGSPRRPRRVRIFCDVDAFVTWGEDPTAVNDGSDGRPMGSENPEYWDLEAGHRIAVIERV